MWKKKKKQIASKFVNGSFIKTENGYFYVISPKRRLRFSSNRVLNSWSPHRVVKTSESAVSHLRVSSKMKFRNGSLIWNLSDAKIYLIEDGKRRWLRSPDVFKEYGIDQTEAVCVSQDEIELHELGEDLT